MTALTVPQLTLPSSELIRRWLVAVAAAILVMAVLPAAIGSAPALSDPPLPPADPAVSLTAGTTTIEIGPAGFTTTGAAPWGLDTTAFGRVGATGFVMAGTIAETIGGAEISHLDGLTAWFDSTLTGIEHGYTIERSPAGVGELLITQTPSGGLLPLVNEAGTGVHWVTLDGTSAGSYDHLVVIDAHGTVLASAMRLTATGDLEITVDDRDAVYPITVDPIITSEVKTSAPTDEAGSEFGGAVSISGFRALVGAHRAEHDGLQAGTAYVLQRNLGGSNNWGREAILRPSDAASSDFFGWAVSLDGDTALISATGDDDNDSGSGSAYIFERNVSNGDWIQQAKITPTDGALGDSFGWGVGLAGDTALIGSPNDDDNGTDSGSAYIFERNNGGTDTWGQTTKLTATDAAADDQFGDSVSLDADTALIGSPKDDDAGAFSGSAYIFERNNGGTDTWGQTTKLTATDAAAVDRFGDSVSIDADTALIGANGDDDDGTESGSAYIFERNNGGTDTWGQTTKLTATDAATFDGFGDSVSIDADTALIGANGDDDDGSGSGSAYIFERNNGGTDNWGQTTKLTATDAAASDYFGTAVGLSGNDAIVGAPGDDDNGSYSGSTATFERDTGGSNAWGQTSNPTANEAQYGYSVSVDGDIAIVGAPYDNENGNESGAAYVLERNLGGTNAWGQRAKLTPSDASPDAFFGWDVSLDGDTALVGAFGDDAIISGAGAAYIFERNNGGTNAWGQTTKLTASDPGFLNTFGASVSLDGDTALIGTPRDDVNGPYSGSAYVFERHNGGPDAWGETSKLLAANGAELDSFGEAVSLDGDTAVIGAYQSAGGSGTAYVFERHNGGADSWGQTTQISPSDGADQDRFGGAVSVSGDTVLIGAWFDDDTGFNSGSAYLFERNQGGGDAWGETAKITGSGGSSYDYFGEEVSLDGDVALIGAHFDDPGVTDGGSTYVFERNNGGPSAWGETVKINSSDTETVDLFGAAVSLDGATALVGANRDDDHGSSSGSAFFFELASSTISSTTAAPEIAVQGETFDITVAGTNDGPDAVDDLTITDPLAPELLFVAAAPSTGGSCTTPPAHTSGTVSCTWAGTTAAAASRDLTITVAIDPATPAASIVQRSAVARVEALNADPQGGLSSTTTVVTPATCGGLVPTIVGTPGDDNLFGTAGDDVIMSFGGDDTINAGAGNDTICTGAGNDTANGEAGNDTITSISGSNTLNGGGGDDVITGGVDGDTIDGGSGADTISDATGTNTLNGSDGDDAITGGADADDIDGGAGADEIDGLAGNDAIDGGTDDDLIIGGSGNDVVSGGLGDDTIVGSSGDDTLNGDDGDDTLVGFSGNDTLNGGAGNDGLIGNSGNDTLDGGAGLDGLFGNAGIDTLLGGDDDDALFGGGDDDQLFGQNGDDLLSGGDGTDGLVGGAGNDTLNGNDGDDGLFGNSGDDTMDGGAGVDGLDGGPGNDTGTGGADGDLVAGKGGNDTLRGGPGPDGVFGGDGDDNLFGEAGDDLINGAAGDDNLDGGDDTDTCNGGPNTPIGDTATNCETTTGIP